MSFPAARWAWAQTLDRLEKPNSKYVLCALADLAGKESAACHPSHKELAARTGLAASTVKVALAHLEGLGVITIEPLTRSNGAASTNRYHLPREEIAGYDGEPLAESRPPLAERRLPPSRETATLDTKPLTASTSSKGAEKSSIPRVSVGKDRLNAEEWEQAQAILATFNAEMGTKFQLLSSRGRPTDHLKRIVLRLRENPDVEMEAHIEMIKRNALGPPVGHWWGPGKPQGVAVLYGPNSFPRCLATDGRPTGRRTFANERSAEPEEQPW